MCANEVETKDDLLWSHLIFTKLLVNESNVRCVFGSHQGTIDLVVDHGDVVVEVKIATRMNTSQTNGWHHSLECSSRSEHMLLEEAELRLHAEEWSLLSSSEPRSKIEERSRLIFSLLKNTYIS